MFRRAWSSLTRAGMSVIALGVNHQFILTLLCKAMKQNSCRGFHADYMGKASGLLRKNTNILGQHLKEVLNWIMNSVSVHRQNTNFFPKKVKTELSSPVKKSGIKVSLIFLLLFGDISLYEACICVFLSEVCSLVLLKVYAATVNYFSMWIQHDEFTSSVNRNRWILIFLPIL